MVLEMEDQDDPYFEDSWKWKVYTFIEYACLIFAIFMTGVLFAVLVLC